MVGHSSIFGGLMLSTKNLALLVLFLLFALSLNSTNFAFGDDSGDFDGDQASDDAAVVEGDLGRSAHSDMPYLPGSDTPEDVMPEEDGLGLGVPPTETKTPMPTVPFVTPPTKDLHWVELFEEDWTTRWVNSKRDKYSGVWVNSLRMRESIIGDHALKVTQKAHHHAIAARLPEINTSTGEELIVSYETKFENDLSCGGAYLKLFDSKGMEISDFDNETPYSIMFGPDRCGATNKVHFIIRSKNPLNGEWTEHHLIDPPSPIRGMDSHLYTLRILPSDEYEIFVDNESVKKGLMSNDFEPPFTPHKEIEDPKDTKPDDWVDEPQMADVDAVKPDDWDEDAPRQIQDPEASMPEGWLVDEPLTIENSEAHKPEDWDDEEDGEWKAPLIANPNCKVGCGKWEAPLIPNIKYKGPWSAPMISNPNYKGPWTPRKIPNSAYFVNKHPSRLSMNIDAVGFELWTMDNDLLFDNIVVARNWAAVQEFIDATFKVRSAIEKSRMPEMPPVEAAKEKASPGRMNLLLAKVSANPMASGIIGFLTCLLFYFSKEYLKCFLLPAKKKTDEPSKTETETSSGKAAKKSTNEDSESSDENTATAVENASDSGKTRKRAGRPMAAD